MLLYIGYQSGTDVVIYWQPEWNCSYILARGLGVMLLFIGYQSGTDVVIYWLPEWN